MRIILGIIAFTLTFGLSASIVGLLFGFPQPEVKTYASNSQYDSVHKHKIKKLLKRDVSNGDIRDVAYDKIYSGDSDSLYRNAEYSQAVGKYVNKSSSMDDASMPADFKYAWREHMKAWKTQATYLESLQNGDVDSDVVSGYSDNTDEINATWNQVLRIAQRYGVQIDASYFQ